MNRQEQRDAQPFQGVRFQNGYQGPERTPFLGAKMRLNEPPAS
jgi:hypothetical protein